MEYYSFIGIAKSNVVISDPLILLGPGMNPFTAHTADLAGLLDRLKAEGVQIQSVHCLSKQEVWEPNETPLALALHFSGSAPVTFQLEAETDS